MRSGRSRTAQAYDDRVAIEPAQREEKVTSLATRWPRAGLLGLVLWLLLMVVSPARAQQVEATVDQTQVAVGDQVTLTIRVSGGSARTPDVPLVRDTRINFIGREESFSLVNSRFTRSIAFNFLVTPLREGTLTLPPIPVSVDGRTVTTRPLQIRVGGSEGSDPGAGGDASEDVFVEAELEPREVYVGQQVLQKVRIFVGVQQGDEARVGRRAIPGTIDEQLPEAIQRRFNQEVKGRTYRVEEITWPFYPVTAGTVTVPAVEVTVPVVMEQRRRRNVDPFFDDLFGGMRQLVPRTFQTDEVRLEVLPLPSQGRPAGFPGLVGRYTVEGELSEQQVPLGDTVTLTVTVIGQGNLRDLQLPPIDSSDFKVYDDAPRVEVVEQNGHVFSRKVFKRALVPQRSGDLSVPPIPLSYFEPVLKRYVDVATGAMPLKVTPGPNGETALAGAKAPAKGAGPQAVKVTGEDILPIHVGAQLEADRDVDITSPGAAALVLAPPLLYGIAAGIRRRREAAEADPVLRRRRQALKTALSSLSAVEKQAAEEGRSRLERLSRIFRGYVGDKLNLEGAALTSGEVRSRLEAAGVSTSLASDAAKLIEQIEQASYAPGGGAASMPGLSSSARDLMQRLEKELK